MGGGRGVGNVGGKRELAGEKAEKGRGVQCAVYE